MRIAILPCNGMDKPEGSVAREVAIAVARGSGAEIVCPVLLHRSPARYKKAVDGAGGAAEDAGALIVVDGCATRCASKLATEVGLKPGRKVLVSEVVKASGEVLEDSLALGPRGMALAEKIAAQFLAMPTEVRASERVASVGWDPPTDFLVVVHDKFEFRIPKQGYWFNENDVWVRPWEDQARVGISDYMQQRLTDIDFFDPPQVGVVVDQFAELGQLESAKAVFEIVAPATGRVVAVNQQVVDAPESVNEDPFGRGWLVQIEPTSWPEDQELLLDGPRYAAAVERKAAEG